MRVGEQVPVEAFVSAAAVEALDLERANVTGSGIPAIGSASGSPARCIETPVVRARWRRPVNRRSSCHLRMAFGVSPVPLRRITMPWIVFGSLSVAGRYRGMAPDLGDTARFPGDAERRRLASVCPCLGHHQNAADRMIIRCRHGFAKSVGSGSRTCHPPHVLPLVEGEDHPIPDDPRIRDRPPGFWSDRPPRGGAGQGMSRFMADHDRWRLPVRWMLRCSLQFRRSTTGFR